MKIHALLDRRSNDDEWVTFVAALRQAVGPAGFISQTKVRPLIQAIPHKRRGQLYARAVKAGVLQFNGFEPEQGKPSRTYLLNERSAA